jgi:antitoxin VapB
MMALNIKNPQVEALAEEVAGLTGETKTEAIRRALEERRARLALRPPGGHPNEQLRAFLEREVWSALPARLLGRKRNKREIERILGYGPEGA